MFVEEVQKTGPVMVRILTRGVLAITNVDKFVVGRLKLLELVKILQVVDNREGNLEPLLLHDKLSPLDVPHFYRAPGVIVSLVVGVEVLTGDDP